VPEATEEPRDVLFIVGDYQVEGNTLMPADDLQALLAKHTGTGLRVAEIEKARAELEKAYHAMGYPTVLVFLPEQTIQAGVVRLTVVESRLGEVTVTGNRYFSTERIMAKLPSLRPGAILYEPTVTKELDAVNTNPDRQVSPVLKPGKETGLVDLDLKVKDRLPLHARLTGDNKGPLTTPQDRLTAELQYTNLWDREHILTVQTTQTPTDWGAVQAYGGSYVAPLHRPGHLLAIYGSYVDSNSVLAGATLTVGPGNVGVAGNAKVAGIRYLFPLGSGGTMTHQGAIGLDYKRLEETTAQFPGDLGTAVVLSPIQYTPASIAYTGLLPDRLGITKFTASFRGYIAGLIPGGDETDFGGDPNDPFNKPGNRQGSTGTFGVVQGGFERLHKLPGEFSLTLATDGQWGTEPLIPAEQFFLGGLDTVRGYVQYEALGDDGVRGRAELLTPELLTLNLDRPYAPRVKLSMRLAAFYDAAAVWIKEAPAGQTDHFRLEGAGFGLRANVSDYLTLHLDQAWALRDATVTQRGDTFVHFVVSAAF
jgi:hemolysin activation/secretion protein